MNTNEFVGAYFYNIADCKDLIKEKIYNGQKVNKENTKRNIHFLLDLIRVSRPEYYATLYDELALQIGILEDLYEEVK